MERNLEVAAQWCIDICHRIITLEGAQKPRSYYEAILRMGELGVLPPDFAGHLAPLAGLRNILVHDYIQIDWDEVYASLASLMICHASPISFDHGYRVAVQSIHKYTHPVSNSLTCGSYAVVLCSASTDCKDGDRISACSHPTLI
nr:DUF86 domain-containing protein [Chloroflexus sp.]